MMEALEVLDAWIVLAINGAHTTFLDLFFWLVSGKAIWIPLYLFILFTVYRSYPLKYFFAFTLLAIASVALADIISAQLIKETVARFRPSHNLNLRDQLHYHVFENGEMYYGGMYGFVSNHATNFAAITFWTIIATWPNKRWISWMVIGVTLCVAYSRIYLGVHYLSDILGGFCVGLTVSVIIFKVFSKRLKLYQ
ncbi:MAG: DUF2127 domain-containing protein [Bacteroidetes bacterium]|nr:DUF2127 domain-containing protein [Bacteroidota bacterium]